jgi:citrate lyase subunit beta/citryl-CoA lyase
MMRSLMFIPADDPRKLERSLSVAADVLIFDLEDAVALANKRAARDTLAAFLRDHRTTITQLVFVRVNDLSTPDLLDDVAATIPFQPNGYVLPKCTGGDDVRTLGHYLDALEVIYPPSGPAAQIIAISTETASSVLGLTTYKDASSRLAGLMWGTEDLSADLGASRSRTDTGWTGTFALVRAQCVIAAAHAGVIAIDAVSTDITDTAALRAETDAARSDGFAAKAAIHPAQVDVINHALSPTDAERDWAGRIIAALENGNGVATLDGRMVDRPHLKLAERILSRTQTERQSGSNTR